MKKRNIAIAGYFDLMHQGHFNLIERFSKEGDVYLLVSKNKNTGGEKILNDQQRLGMASKLNCIEKAQLIDLSDIDELKKVLIDNDINIYVTSVEYLSEANGKFKSVSNLILELKIDLYFVNRTEGISSSEIRKIIKGE